MKNHHNCQKYYIQLYSAICLHFVSCLFTFLLSLFTLFVYFSGTKEDIIVCQEKHEQLTTLSQKAERLCLQRKNQIKKVEGEIEKAKLELNKAHEAHLKTQETLNATQAEAADLGWYDYIYFQNLVFLIICI